MKPCQHCPLEADAVEATSQFSVNGAEPIALCASHAQAFRNELSSSLTSFQETSIAQLPLTVDELLALRTAELEEARADLAAAEKRTEEVYQQLSDARQRIALQQRQLEANAAAVRDSLGQRERPTAPGVRPAAGAAAGDQRLEGREVKPLAGVDAVAGADSPEPEAKLSNAPAER
jgi:hypothetical protein